MPFWKKREPVWDLVEAGQKAHMQGDLSKALTIFAQVIEKARAAGDKRAEAAGLQRRGVTRDMRAHSQGAEADVRQALAIDLQLEGKDGATVRQDWFTLGVI